MKAPSFYDAFQVLLLQAADDGRGEALFGDSIGRVRKEAEPFLIGNAFPSVYLEFPLVDDPFLDVTFLYSDVAPGTRIDSAATPDTGPMMDWLAEARQAHEDICCGFELDTKEPNLPRAAIHFQPRAHVELVKPFCAAIGEEPHASTYLELAKRMPKGWPLSFFGMFRGRPGSPLRVCGYLDDDERDACAQDPKHLAAAFDAIRFAAYDDAMLKDVSALMAAAPETIDFQFDVHPDGRLGETFAVDIQFGIEQPAAVRDKFASGAGAHIMGLLQSWGAADDRWRLSADAAFARALPMERDDGTVGRFAFTLMPQWVKARWRAGALQPSKLYYYANAAFVEKSSEETS